jgi:hypothetical protein
MRHVEVKADGCWMWTGSTRQGYGQIWTSSVDGERSLLSAHRAMYEVKVGPIPAGHDVDHRCHDVTCVPPCLHRLCVNPDHLKPATRGDNIRRGQGLAAQNARKTHCSSGHRFHEPARPGHVRKCLMCVEIRRLARLA